MGDAAASSSQPAQAAAAASASSSAASRSLLSALQASLAPLLSSPRLPRGALRLHALFSAPRPALELFPFAHVGGSGSAGVGAPLEARVEHVFCTAAWSDEEEDELAEEAQPSGESQAASLASQATTSDVGSASTTAAGPGGRTSRLIYALECFLYTIPSTHAAILYVSKLDSSGWAPAVVPAAVVPFLPSASEGGSAAGCSLVRAITIGFLRHFASLEHWASAPTPVEHCSIHVLARAQPAYLFPSSPDNPSKHVLSDGKLIAWWRGVLSDVAKEQSNAEGRNFYIVPGYDERM
jgi:regulator of Ty1 transposition protein 109